MPNMNNPEEEGKEHATNRNKSYWFVSPGSKVEVRSDEDGYQNAWFSATVLDQVTPSKSRTKRRTEAVVVYDHMLDEETQEPLVERVDVRLIRPTPPEDVRTVLEPNDIVDAFYDEVWWTGYVVRRVNDRYTVAFKCPPDVLEVGRSDLRVHWDWVDNSFWDKPSKEATTRSIFSPTMEVEVDPKGDKPVTTWFPGVYLGETSFGYHMVKYNISSGGDDEEGLQKIQVDYDQIRPCPPKIEEKDFELLEKVDAFNGLAWTVGVVTKVLVENKYTVTFKNLKKEVDFDCSKLRPHMDWIDRKWVSKSKGMEFKSKHQEIMRQCDLTKSIEIITLDESSSSATIGDNEEVTVFKPRKQKDSSPIFGSSIKEKVNLISNDKSAKVMLTGNDEITSPNEVEEMTNCAIKSAEKRETPQKFNLGEISWPNKRKRSRLSKSRFQNLQSSATCINEAEKEIYEVLVDNGVETADNDMETSNPVTEDGGLESVYPEQAQSSGSLPEPKDFMDTDIVDKVYQPPIESDIEMGCGLNQVQELPESPILNLETQTETDNGIGKEYVFAIQDCSTEKLESVIHACSKSTGNGVSEARVGIEDCTNGMLEASSSACLKLTDSQGHDSANCLKNVNGSDFPFAKSSPIWKFLQSMDVFVRFPQSPHFRPLSKHFEKEREGLAVGHMVNFANMMVRISKLRENVSKEDIDHIIRGFSMYEELGFDLKFVKDRLDELLKTKAQIENLEDESKRLASSVKEFVDQEAIIEKEVTEIDLEIEKLTRKRAMLMSDCTEHRSKIARLSLEAEAIDADLLSRREYSSSLMIVIYPQLSP